MLRRILCFMLVALLALPLAEAPPLADAKLKKKIVTKTFSNSSVITIPGAGDEGPASPYPSAIRVGGLKKAKILDVNVTLRNFNHTDPDEVDVLLVASHLPGRTATILSDTGNTDAINATLFIDDEAPLPTQNDAIVSGTFQPNNGGAFVDPFPAPAPIPSGNALLNVFDGGRANGLWQLFIVDDAMADTGNFAGGWSIQIKAQVKEKVKTKGGGKGNGKGKKGKRN
jgi:hypothetical protein